MSLFGGVRAGLRRALKSDSDVASIKDAAPAPSQDPCRLISYEIAVHIIFYPELPPPAAVLYM